MINISDPLTTWDRSVTSLALQTRQKFADIAKFPNLEMLIAEGQEISEPHNIDLLHRLLYAFLRQNGLEAITQFKKMQNLVLLDLSENDLDLFSLVALRSVKIEYLTFYGNKRAQDQMQSLPDHISQKKTHFQYNRLEKNYPMQGQCICRMLYSNILVKDDYSFICKQHIRLFLINLFPFAASLNYQCVGECERELAIRYYETHFAELTAIQQQCILQTKKNKLQNFNQTPPSQHYFIFKNLIGHYGDCQQQHPCDQCARLHISKYLDGIRFPNKELRHLLLQVLQLLQISRYFELQDKIEQYNANTIGQPKNAYGQMVIVQSSFTPFLLCELFTLNHVLQKGEVRSPKDFLQLGITIVENDAFCSYFAGIMQRQTAEKISDGTATLNALYGSVIQLGEYFIKSVEIDDQYEAYAYDCFEKNGKRGRRTDNIAAEVQMLFHACDGLTLNSLRFFLFQVRAKANIVKDMANMRQRSVNLRNIDIFETQGVQFVEANDLQRQQTQGVVQRDSCSLFRSELDVLQHFGKSG